MSDTMDVGTDTGLEMDVDPGVEADGPRGAKRKADALDDTATPRRIKVRWRHRARPQQTSRVRLLRLVPVAKPALSRLSTRMSSTRSPPAKSLWPRSTR